MPVPTPTPHSPVDPGIEAELRARLKQLHKDSRLTYDQLADRVHLSRSSIGNYLNTPAGRPVETLQQLLDALGACDADRVRVLELHRETLPGAVDQAEVGWRARALVGARLRFRQEYTGMTTPEDVTDYLQELLRREKAGERHLIEVGPYTAMMITGAIQWTFRRAKMAEHGPAIFEGLLDQLRLLFVDDPKGSELIRIHDQDGTSG